MIFIRDFMPETRKILERMTPKSLLQYLKKLLDHLGAEYVINFAYALNYLSAF
ncbi:MAG: hypothetical protein QNJ74_18440 [Trichodesmium sp. MO_231.B1]|nr:hypothetical protein [Trichodesmium sp. MO_231.B1]